MKKQVFLLVLFLPLLVHAQSYDDIKNNGEIKVSFTESGTETVNYLLAKEFSKFLNVDFQEVPINWSDVFAKNGRIPENHRTDPNIRYTPDALKKSDFICGTIYLLDWREKFFDYAGIVQISDLLIVRKNINTEVNSFEDLKGLKIAFLENSTYETEISEINSNVGGGIKFIPVKSENEGLAILNQGKADGLITVSYLALAYLQKFRSLKLAFPVASPKDVGWAVKKGNTKLVDEIENFFETIKGNGTLNKIFRKKYGISYSTYLEIINSYAQLQKGIKTRDLDAIMASGKIVIALRDREMIYHRYGKKQFNHYMAEEFAQYLGLQHEIVITQKFANYWENDKNQILKDSAYLPDWFKKFDVACDLIAPLDWRLKKVDVIDFMPNAKVVIGRKETKITSLDDLKSLRGVTSKGSSYEHTLKENGINNLFYSPGNEFFSHVKSGKADYTISNIAVFNLAAHPELEAKFILGEITKMGWAIKKNQPALRQKILEFLEYAQNKGIIDNFFKEQTGMTMKSAKNYLNVLQETYQHGNFPFMFYGAEQGLPREEILSIFQDNNRYIWFGTHSGAVKYDGLKMKVINSKSGLIGNSVFDIKQDKDNKLYFCTNNGINISNPEASNFKTIFSGISFKGIFIDQDNNKYFYGDGGIRQLNKSGKRINLESKLKALPSNIHSMSQNPLTGDIIITSTQGLYLMSATNSFVNKLDSGNYHTAFFESDGDLWVSSNDGLKHVRSKHLENKDKYTSLNHTLNIPKHIVIRDIMESDDGSVWLITDYKVYQILTLKQKPIVYDKNIGLKNYRVLSFLIDKELNFWFGLSGGIQKLSNKALRTLFPEQLNSPVHSIFEDNYGRMWFSMSTGLYYFKNGLHNFSKSLDLSQNSLVTTLSKDSKLYIANSEKLMILDNESLKLIKEIEFKTPLIHPEDIFVSSDNQIFILTGINGIIYYLKDSKSEIIRIENKSTQMVSQLGEFDGKILGAAETGLTIFKNKSFKTYIRTNNKVWSFCEDEQIDDKTGELEKILQIGTTDGILIYDPIYNLYSAEYNLPSNTVIKAIEPADDKNYLWLGTASGLIYFNKKTGESEFKIDSKNGLLGNEITVNGIYLDGRGLLWVGTYHGASTYDIKKKKSGKLSPVCSIGSIQLNGSIINKLPKTLKSFQNNITFEISGLLFKNESSVLYEYYLRGDDGDQRNTYTGRNNIANFQNLPPGKYVFQYRAKGSDNIWSYFEGIPFEIEKPLYAKWWFILIQVLVAGAIVYLIFKWRIRILKRRNEILEETVKDRTLEIREKNAELESSKEEIQAQSEIAIKQRDEISKKKKEIEDSILYAQRIQNAILPPKEFINKNLPDNFILFRPRDIVSGDFYWAAQNSKKTFIAAADCTGHGVPGAFMSMLGVSFLNEIVATSNADINAGEILDKLRTKIIEALHQTGETHEAKDGMDISLCAVHNDSNKLDFAGAFNPLYLVRDNEIHVTDADRMPIGIYEYDQDKRKFKNNIIEIKKGDSVYMFSDGYPDQFGGKRGKKFMIGRFKKLILKINPLSTEEQREYMDNTIIRWMEGTSEQIDDILVIGAKF
ncbi:MAG: transporter substrate-binding domain-containing protein [Bacteroidota bacterium]|nr:transporter substrate-binding domain-containing protein [Bacteroidota bacterium]